MNALAKVEEPLPGKESAAQSPDRIPQAVQKMMESTPRKLWSKIRAILIESEEEGELVEMLPEMNRVMKVCPPKLLGLVRKRKLTGAALDQGYTQLHDALHGVRQAMYALLHLAGYRDYRLPGTGGSGPKDGESDPPPEPGSADAAPPAPIAKRTTLAT